MPIAMSHTFGAARLGQSVVPSNYVADILTDSPAFYLQLNDEGPTTANDTSTNNRDGTFSGTGLSFQQAPGPMNGIQDEYLNLTPGSTPHVQLTDATVDSTIGAADQEYTFEIWLRSTGTSQGVFEKTVTSGGTNWNSLAMVGSIGGRIRFQLYDGSNNPLVDSTTTVNDGSWYHVVCMRCLTTGVHSANELRLYVNGSLEANAAASNTIDTSTSQIVELGYRSAGSGAGQFTGDLCHAACYFTALSDARVLSHYTTATTTP